MPYPSLRKLADEAAYRLHYEMTYCVSPILTFDGISVRFRKNLFDHCFYESTNRDKVKDLFSTLRAERIDWIAATLQDKAAELFVGWDGQRKQYDYTRRVALVQSNYVVVIRIMKGGTDAEFGTAYVADTPRSLEKLSKGPKWT